MNFTVRWLKAAEVQLAALWIRSADRDELAELADVVNRLLRDRPFDLGESRERASLRVWFHRPLCVRFLIDETAGVVYVAGVKWVGH
jgi:hypothetical protein